MLLDLVKTSETYTEFLKTIEDNNIKSSLTEFEYLHIKITGDSSILKSSQTVNTSKSSCCGGGKVR